MDDAASPSTRVRVSYEASPQLGPATERILYMPRFEDSGHFVAATEPAKLFAEVSQFLSETGLLVGGAQ